MAMNPIRWWHWLPKFSWRVAGTVEHADEVPDHLPSKIAIVVGSTERPKWLAFDCPCRTGHRILIPVDPAQRPSWSLVDTSPLTIAPSVDSHSPGRRCHYFIRSGRVVWA